MEEIKAKEAGFKKKKEETDHFYINEELHNGKQSYIELEQKSLNASQNFSNQYEVKSGRELEKSLAMDQTKVEGLMNELESMEDIQKELEDDDQIWDNSDDNTSIKSESSQNKHRIAESSDQNDIKSPKDNLKYQDRSDEEAGERVDQQESDEIESMKGYTSTQSRNIKLPPPPGSKDNSMRNLKINQEFKQYPSEKLVSTNSAGMQPTTSEIIPGPTSFKKRLAKTDQQRKTFDIDNGDKNKIIIKNNKFNVSKERYTQVISDEEEEDEEIENEIRNNLGFQKSFKKKNLIYEDESDNQHSLKFGNFNKSDRSKGLDSQENFAFDQGGFKKGRNRLNSDDFEEIEGNGVIFINNDQPDEKIVLNPDLVSPLGPNMDMKFGFEGQFGTGMGLNLQDSLTAYENRDTDSSRNINSSSIFLEIL